MSESKDTQEPSMEEILSSIRRIIADEQEDEADRPAEASRVDAGTVDLRKRQAAGAAKMLASPAPKDDDDDDVLELTEIAHEGDGAGLTGAKNTPQAPPDVPEAPLSEAPPPQAPLPEVPMTVQGASAQAPGVPVSEPVSEKDGMSTQDMAAKGPEPVKEHDPMSERERDELISTNTADASSDAFARLTKAYEQDEGAGSKPIDRGDHSVEMFLSDMLRPLLKEWLDANLPQMVERVVEQEVKKLARRAELR